MNVISKNSPALNSLLADLESAIQRQLPDVLRDFLRRHDGVELDELNAVFHPISEECPFRNIPLARILGICKHNPDVLTIEEALHDFVDLIPFNSIPFAQDAFGGIFTVDLDNHDVDYVNVAPTSDGTPATWFETGFKISDIILKLD